MSTINSKNVQVGTSGVAAQNFTLYQPATPDGTVRLGVGNSGATTGDVVTVNSSGVTVTGTLTATTISGAVTGTTGSFSGNLSFNSGYGSAAVAYGCRAWVNFNGTSTVSITASGNVSSITDNGVGDYTVNFTNALADANYNFVTNSSNTTSANILCIAQLNWDNPTKSTSALRLYNLKTNTGALTDQNTISVSIFR